ncbi:MAG: aldehyde dehydrogenase family protein [Verrucomicrobiae bacterium]|nr:aldehyde dehydrogenase family protein [Verrucomicrobiae bacterium]
MKKFTTQLVINGKLCHASDRNTLTLINPATEKKLCEVASASLKDLETSVTGAQKAFEKSWRDMTPGKRTEILFRFTQLIVQHQEELAQLEMLNIGMPISNARGELQLTFRIAAYYTDAISKFCGQTIPVARGGFDYTLRSPLGVVAAIVPWNFPLSIAAWKIFPALAAGNCVVLKPASLSPLTAIKLGILALEAGLPDGVLQVLPGSGQRLGDALVQHPLIRKISFTGSTEIGTHIMKMAADDMKRVSLELGGKSPNIVFNDADLEKVAALCSISVFDNTGQDCCARSRVFVEQNIFDEFVKKFIQASNRLIIGDPSHPKTQIGPLISKQHRDHVQTYLDSVPDHCQKIVCGKTPLPKKGFYMRPVVILGCNTREKVWREEIFGPVVCIRPFRDENSMLREVNESHYGLSGSIWTNDLKRALRVAKRVESGVLSINSINSVHVAAPFGGFKRSGIGRDLGMTAMEGYTELKNIYITED